MRNFILYTDDGEVVLPTVWVICGYCRGDGTSSAHLGDVTEWLAEETQETRDDYANGRYDRACDDCGGTGKVREVDVARLHGDLRAAWEAQERDRREMEHVEYMERLMGA